jgi:hypothetical protein
MYCRCTLDDTAHPHTHAPTTNLILCPPQTRPWSSPLSKIHPSLTSPPRWADHSRHTRPRRRAPAQRVHTALQGRRLLCTVRHSLSHALPRPCTHAGSVSGQPRHAINAMHAGRDLSPSRPSALGGHHAAPPPTPRACHTHGTCTPPPSCGGAHASATRASSQPQAVLHALMPRPHAEGRRPC